MRKILISFICVFISLTKIGDSCLSVHSTHSRASENTLHRSPILTTTAIIEVFKEGQIEGIVLIERGKAPWGKALPGGKVEYGETVEQAVRREMQEEVGLELFDLRQFHVYSDPQRDFRHHSVEITHLAKSHQHPIAGDDAAQAFVVPFNQIPWSELAFDHAQILQDYLAYRLGNQSLIMIKH